MSRIESSPEPPMASADAAMIDALYRISSLASERDDPREALEIIIDEIMRMLPASSAAIELINPDTELLEIEVFRGFPEDSREVQLRLGQGVTGWVALHGKPLLIPDVSAEPRYIPVCVDVRCELAVPMISGDGTTIGVVNVASDVIDAFGERHLKVLTLLTNEATKVVSRLWMFHKLREQAEQLRALAHTARSIVEKREIGELLQSITNETRDLMHCRACALYLYDRRQHRLVLEAISGIPEAVARQEMLALEESTLGTAIRRRKTIEVNDLARTEENHFVHVVQHLGLVSLLCSPIAYENEVIGVLNAYTDRPHRFSDAEKRVFETLAGLSAVVIQNSRLYTRIFNSEETLRRTERLTMLGLLSAEIAHEIRNPLTVIRLLFDALDLRFVEDDPRARDVTVIQDKIGQLDGIVSRVLSVGKSREDLRTRLDLRKVLDDTLHLIRLKLQQCRIELEVTECASAVMVEASRGQLQQALLNLLLNATQAMPDGGRIRVRCEVEESSEALPVAVVTIADTGHGIPEHLKDGIFDSFLTGRAEGTGLGLSIVKRILRSHHGDVELSATSPAGTTMRIWLPIH